MKRSEQSVPAILIADDDALVGLVMSRSLRSRGYLVTVVHTREECVQACTLNDFDLAIVDVHMPGPDLRPSLALMAELKPLLRMMVISGDAERPHWLTSEIAYLSKPFGIRELLGEVDHLLGSGALPAARPGNLLP
jgi:CheY-like chemotaxis protein